MPPGFGFRDDSFLRGARGALPGLDCHRSLGAAPRTDDLPVDEQRTGPYPRRPELATSAGVRHEQRALFARAVQGVGVAAR
jgi:hypothetical protein